MERVIRNNLCSLENITNQVPFGDYQRFFEFNFEKGFTSSFTLKHHPM